MLTNTLQQTAETTAIETSKTVVNKVTKKILGKELFHKSITGLSIEDLEQLLQDQLTTFKDTLLQELSQETHLSPEQQYIITESTLQNLQTQLNQTQQTTQGLEELLQKAFQESRGEMKEWWEKEWTAQYGQLLAEIDDLQQIQITTLLTVFGQKFDTILDELKGINERISKLERYLQEYLNRIETVLPTKDGQLDTHQLQEKYALILSSITCSICGYTTTDPGLGGWTCPKCNTAFEVRDKENQQKILSFPKLMALSIFNGQFAFNSPRDIAYDQNLFVPREDIEQHFQSFINSTKSLWVITGEAGIGKTWLVAHLISNYSRTGGLSYYIHLREGFTYFFQQLFQDSFLGVLESIEPILNTLQQPLLFVLDGWDEMSILDERRIIIVNFLLHAICPRFSTKIKVIITSRKYDWDIEDTVRINTVNLTHYGFDIVQLTIFTPEQVQIAMKNYHIPPLTALDSVLQELIKYPLWIRLISEYITNYPSQTQYTISNHLLTDYFERMGLDTHDQTASRNYNLFTEIIYQLYTKTEPSDPKLWSTEVAVESLTTNEQKSFVKTLSSAGIVEGSYKQETYSYYIHVTQPIFGMFGLALFLMRQIRENNNQYVGQLKSILGKVNDTEKEIIYTLMVERGILRQHIAEFLGKTTASSSFSSSQLEVDPHTLVLTIHRLEKVFGSRIYIQKIAQHLNVPVNLVVLELENLITQKIDAHIDTKGISQAEDDVLVLLTEHWDIEQREWEQITTEFTTKRSQLDRTITTLKEQLNQTSESIYLATHLKPTLEQIQQDLQTLQKIVNAGAEFKSEVSVSKEEQQATSKQFSDQSISIQKQVNEIIVLFYKTYQILEQKEKSELLKHIDIYLREEKLQKVQQLVNNYKKYSDLDRKEEEQLRNIELKIQKGLLEATKIGSYHGVSLVQKEIKVLEMLEKQLGSAIPNIEKIDDYSFGFQKKDTFIIGIGLFNKELTSLPENIGQLNNLQELYISDNKLIYLPESLGELTKLQILNLVGNQLTSFPESFRRLKSLQRLSLSYNQLTSLPENFGQLTNLQELYLWGHQLISLPEKINKILRELKSHGCFIHEIDRE